MNESAVCCTCFEEKDWKQWTYFLWLIQGLKLGCINIWLVSTKLTCAAISQININIIADERALFKDPEKTLQDKNLSIFFYFNLTAFRSIVIFIFWINLDIL